LFLPKTNSLEPDTRATKAPDDVPKQFLREWNAAIQFCKQQKATPKVARNFAYATVRGASEIARLFSF
jgi:hypothetical protein